jgi:hypothetical protein
MPRKTTLLGAQLEGARAHRQRTRPYQACLNPKRVAVKTGQAQGISGGHIGDPKTRIRRLSFASELWRLKGTKKPRASGSFVEGHL